MAVADDADGVHELLRLGVLQEEPARAGAQGVHEVVVTVEGRQDDDLREVARDDLPGRLDPVGTRHLHVHQHDVRRQPSDHLDGGGTVAGLADDLEVRFDAEDHREARTDQRLVVDDDDAQDLRTGLRHRVESAGSGVRDGSTCSACLTCSAWSTFSTFSTSRSARSSAVVDLLARGSRTRTRNPPVARGPISSEPSREATRSRIPQQSEAGAGGSGAWASGVQHLDLGEPVRGRPVDAQDDGRSRCRRVPADVVEGLLDGAVERETDRRPEVRRRIRRVGHDGVGDVESVGAQLVDEAGNGVDGGFGGATGLGGGAVPLAQRAEEGAHLGHRLARRRLHRGERRRGGLGVDVEDAARRRRLDPHHGHVVGDDVVQLTGDAEALLDDGVLLELGRLGTQRRGLGGEAGAPTGGGPGGLPPRTAPPK